jgi:hypothetical protein
MLDNRQTNNRQGSEWYECGRCGFQYPRARVLVQNGLVVCQGDNTNNCVDAPGAAAYFKQLNVPYEERPAPLPYLDEDL